MMLNIFIRVNFTDCMHALEDGHQILSLSLVMSEFVSLKFFIM